MRRSTIPAGLAVLLAALLAYAGEADKTLTALAFPKEQWPAGLALAKLPDEMATQYGISGVPFVSDDRGLVSSLAGKALVGLPAESVDQVMLSAYRTEAAGAGSPELGVIAFRFVDAGAAAKGAEVLKAQIQKDPPKLAASLFHKQAIVAVLFNDGAEAPVFGAYEKHVTGVLGDRAFFHRTPAGE